jgi:hypothetical protein
MTSAGTSWCNGKMVLRSRGTPFRKLWMLPMSKSKPADTTSHARSATLPSMPTDKFCFRLAAMRAGKMVGAGDHSNCSWMEQFREGT